MSFTENVKNGLNYTADMIAEFSASIAEKNRLHKQLKSIEKLIKTDTATRDQAYIELGRYFYENLREGASAENEALCVVIDTADERISKASLKYVEVMNLQNSTSIRSENAEKLGKIISEKAKESAKIAKEKGTEFAENAKSFATEKAEIIRDKVTDATEDVKERFAGESADIEELIRAEQEKMASAQETVEATAEAVEEAVTDAVEQANEAVKSEESPESFDF